MKKVTILTDGEMREQRTALIQSKTYFIAGTHTMFVPITKTKYVLKNVIREWPDLNGELVHMTPGEAARTELERQNPDLKRTGFNKKHLVLFDNPPPMVYTGPYAGEGYHADISACYGTICNYFTVDCKFPMMLGSAYMNEAVFRLWKWKPARNAIVGVTKMRKITSFRGEERKTIHFKNRWLNPQLWGNIQLILWEIARIAVDLGAIYINTDGFIFDNPDNGLVFKEILQNAGFNLSGEAGDVFIRGWGRYATPLKVTKIFDNYRIEPNESKWSNIEQKFKGISDTYQRNNSSLERFESIRRFTGFSLPGQPAISRREMELWELEKLRR